VERANVPNKTKVFRGEGVETERMPNLG